MKQRQLASQDEYTSLERVKAIPKASMTVMFSGGSFTGRVTELRLRNMTSRSKVHADEKNNDAVCEGALIAAGATWSAVLPEDLLAHAIHIVEMRSDANASQMRS